MYPAHNLKSLPSSTWPLLSYLEAQKARSLPQLVCTPWYVVPPGTHYQLKFEDPIFGAYWNLDDASVMTSSYSRNSDGGFWTFSTLSTTYDGYHPIAGSRQFGVSTNSNGGYTFYIRAADRTFDAATNIFGGQNRVFRSAEVTWNAVCRNIFMYVNNSGGKALTPSTPISKRVPWENVREQTK